MRPLRQSLAAIVALSPAVFAVACGSGKTATPEPSADAGLDSSASDGSSATDGSNATDGSLKPSDAAAADATTDAPPAQPVDDAATLEALCPVLDAAGFVEAKFGPLPTMAYGGGPLLDAVQVVTMTFPTTPGVATLQSFGQTLPTTPWFKQVTKDYCINDGGTCFTAGTPGVSVEMKADAAALYVDMMGYGPTDAGVDLDQFMIQQVELAVDAGQAPPPGANSLYAFYFPQASTISMGPPSMGGGESCVQGGFGGYHSALPWNDAGTVGFYYAILPDCASGGTAADDLEGVTIAASHEIIEAATDPIPGYGWYLDQAQALDAGPPTTAQFNNQPWGNAVGFGELGDNCESTPNVFLDSGVAVQRIWSQSAAAAGHNPCVPVPAGETYYNTSTDKVLYVADAGSSFTVEVTAFSDVARPSWQLAAADGTQSQTSYLSFAFAGGVQDSSGNEYLLCVNNGTKAQLTVTLLADPNTDPNLGNYEVWPEADGIIESVDIANPIGTGANKYFPTQLRPFAVVTPAIAAEIGVTSGGVVDAEKLAQIRAEYARKHPKNTNRAPAQRRTIPRFRSFQ